MKKLNDIFFSMLTSVILLVIFGASIAYATFAENNSGTEYAKQIVYNAKWFEVLFVLLIVNLLGSAVRYQLFKKRKFSVLLFHLAFICIIIGAAVTRFYGSEGVMHIRQGETSNEISSDKTSVRILAEFKGEKVEKSKEASFSETGSNAFSESVAVGGKTITVENELFIPNSVETIVPDEQGEPALSLFVMNGQNQGMDFILLNGESNSFGDVSFGFGDSIHKADISFTLAGNQLFFKTALPLSKMSMMQKTQSMMMPGAVVLAEQKTIYKADNILFVLKTYMPKAKKNLTQATPEMEKTGIIKKGKDAIIFKVSDGNITKRVNVLSSENQTSLPATCQLNDVKVSLSYGMLQHKLPFNITLRSFQLDRYPGSNSPSSYASEITLTDTELKSERPFRIYMNNILNYRGYRFFQSSYDPDEKGTILSVSHDYWGTLISYIGYFIMALGMILTLFNKDSRFRTVLRLSNELQVKRKSGKTLLLAGMILLSGSMFAMGGDMTRKAHMNALNSLLIQDEAQGRVEPFNTFASDVLRKITKKTSYNSLSAVEVLLGMSSNPANWQNEPMIKVANAQLAKELGAVNDYVSFNQLFDFDNGGAYRLKEKIDKVYQKEQSTHNKYDKEIVNVDERVNICYQLFNGNMLALFPIPGHNDGKWSTAKPIVAEQTQTNPHAGMVGMNGMGAPAGMGGMEGKTSSAGMGSTESKTPPSMDDIKGKTPPPGMGSIEGKTPPAGMGGMSQEQLNSMMGKSPVAASALSNDSPEMLLTNYFKAANEAILSGNWGPANEQLIRIKSYQLLNGGNNLPSATKIKLEIFYNNLNIFGILAIIYVIMGFVLLMLHLVDIFKVKSGLEKYLKLAIYPFVLVFGLYTAGLAIRWYISSHAPWSNGYETMIFVGWAAALSGLIFARKSPITLSVTGILSAIALFVAGMSWMNPEITNLVPVLKSYWLIVHVAIITSSYGFLAMGALLGLLNLILMIAQSKKNAVRLKDSIQEISYIIEMALIIGLLMLTIGCFIGGVWANESWGRYWGWDPKETWALVSIVVYSAILHLRNVPKANNQFVLSSLALIGLSTIIMTFFGVNYYLSGMHSYAQGTPPPVPAFVYFIIIGVFGLVILAYNSVKKNKI
ncbi:MAG: cytochrome c biogenesis protein CcsA [Paludibacter sp.]|nr:cytochrome c biogenesis protein CcsA [Paludibacter sp.]